MTYRNNCISTLLCAAGRPFTVDGVAAVVERRVAAASGFASDFLVCRLAAASTPFSRHAFRVREIDAMFASGRARLVQEDQAGINSIVT